MRLYEFDKIVRLVPGSSIPDRTRESENKDLYKRLHYMIPQYLDDEEVLIVEDGRRIVGALGLQKSPYDDNVYWIKYVEVEVAYQNQGISIKLIKAAFEFAREREADLTNSTYTPQGAERIKKIFDRISKEFPDVNFREQNQR